MTRDYEAEILGALLDRLERSRHAKAPGSSKRRVFLRCDRRELPDYWNDSSADYRWRIHQAVERLAAAGVVVPRWVRGREGRELERIDLELARVGEAYRLAGRIPPWERRQRLIDVVDRWSWPEGDWRERFRQELLSALESGGPFPAGLRRDLEEPVLADLLRSLDGLGRIEGDVPRRVFSLQELGDSKRLEEAVLPHLRRVLAAYHPLAGEEDDGAGDLLERVGLVPHPRPVLVAGPVSLVSPSGKEVDLGAFQPYVGVPPTMLDAPVVGGCATQVVTVENLTSFHQLAAMRPADWVVVYLGGFAAGPGLRFLRRLAEGMPGAAFYHWGDIDLGGFRIFAFLRRAIGIAIQPYRMDEATFRAHLHLARPFGSRYRSALEGLLADDEYAVFYGVVGAMLEAGCRLEQESVAPL